MPGVWFESHVDLRDHPKTDLLMELLCVTRRDAVGLLHFVWGRAMTYAPSGDLSAVTDAQIARWADWDGAPSALVGALMTAGFLDASRVLHDWDIYAGRWIEARAKNAEKQRTWRAKQKAESAYPSRDGLRNGHVGGLPDLTGPDLNRTGPDPTPQTPLRTAEGGAADAAGGKRRRKDPVEIPEPVPTEPELAPLDAEAVQLWRAALDAIRERGALNDGNLEQVCLLEPLGRDPAGALHLRAPPGIGLERFRQTIVLALSDAGDAAARGVVIVEG